MTHRVGDGKWTAIGMSENPFMPRSDLVVGYVKPDGTGVVEDRWAVLPDGKIRSLPFL